MRESLHESFSATARNNEREADLLPEEFHSDVDRSVNMEEDNEALRRTGITEVRQSQLEPWQADILNPPKDKEESRILKNLIEENAKSFTSRSPLPQPAEPMEIDSAYNQESALKEILDKEKEQEDLEKTIEGRFEPTYNYDVKYPESMLSMTPRP